MKRLLVLFLLLLSSPTLVLAGAATLSWSPPTENEDGTPLTDLAWYNIYHGTTSSGPYSSQIIGIAPNATSHVVTNLAVGTHYFVSTAVNDAGAESVWSNEAIKDVADVFGATNGTVFSVAKSTNMFVLIAVGSVPVGTECDPDQSVNGNYVVPINEVTWSGTVRPDVVVAECG